MKPCNEDGIRDALLQFSSHDKQDDQCVLQRAGDDWKITEKINPWL